MPHLTMPYSTSSFPMRFRNITHKSFIWWMILTACAFFWVSSANAQTPTNAATSEAEALPPPKTEMSSSSSVVPPYTSRAMRDKTLIAKALEDEGKWLDTTYGKILVMHRPTEAKVTKGVLVLFHAAEDPQSWPPVLENLRQNLPRYGWETLAVTMPQAASKLIPERENESVENTGSNNEDDADKPVENPASPAANSSSLSSSSANNAANREELIKEYIKVSFEFLHTNGQFNAVVLFDNSSLFLGMQQLLPQIKENKSDPNTVDGPIQALVIANLQPQEALNKQQLNITLNQQQLPVMDIFFAPDVEQQKAQRELHRAAAMRNKLDNYQQFITEIQPKSVEDDHSSFLVGRVRGFMKAVATGSEIKTEK